MAPYDKLRSIVFTISTALLFFIWSLLTKLSPSNVILNTILGAVSSLGTYRIILKIMETLIVKIPIVKKFIYGNSYLEGVWIGAYIGTDDKPRYYIEYFEQDFTGLIIRGFCYNEDYSYKGNWVSDRVYINEKNGTITYTYVTEMIRNNTKNQGLASFNFYRNNKKDPPMEMIGFSSDIFSPQKFQSFEWKLSEKEKNYDRKRLLKLAEERYINVTKNKSNINNS